MTTYERREELMVNGDIKPSDVEVSVIVGFKDWGIERLELSIGSIHASLGGVSHEIIISDYGSTDQESIACLARQVGAVHERVETDGEWSRSRALNAGVRVAKGKFILATDADMLFSPDSLRSVVERLKKHPYETIIMQCRDLPVGYSHEVVKAGGLDWQRFEEISQVRPRWGMGGLVGVDRRLWEILRGWDERMHTYGGEDIDFAKRAMKYGSRINWIDEPGLCMYHIWHPASSLSAARSREATAAIERNREIHNTDETFARNRCRSRYLPMNLPPQVTVLLDSTNASKKEVSASLASILLQTIEDVEIILINDSEGFASKLGLRSVGTFKDALADLSGIFVTVAQAGDLWLEDRLENLLNGWQPNVGIISDYFANVLQERGKDAILPQTITNSALYFHSALLLSRLIPDRWKNTGLTWPQVVSKLAASSVEWKIVSTVGAVTFTEVDQEEEETSRRDWELSSLRTVLSSVGLGTPAMSSSCTFAPQAIQNVRRLLSEDVFELDAFEFGNRVIPELKEIEKSFFVKPVFHVETLGGKRVLESKRYVTSDPAQYALLANSCERFGITISRQTASEFHLSNSTKGIGINLEELGRYLENVHGSSSESVWVVAFKTANKLTNDSTTKELDEFFRSQVGATTVVNRVLKMPSSSRTFAAIRFTAKREVEANLLSATVALYAETYQILVEQPKKEKF